MEGELKKVSKLQDVIKRDKKITIEGDNGLFELYLVKTNPLEKKELKDLYEKLQKDNEKEIIDKKETHEFIKSLDFMTKDELVGSLIEKEKLSKEMLEDTIKVESDEKLDDDKIKELKDKRIAEIVAKKKELLEKKDIEELKTKVKEDYINLMTHYATVTLLGDWVMYYVVREVTEEGEIGDKYFKSIDEVKYLDDEIKQLVKQEIGNFGSSLSQIQIKNLLTIQ